MINVVSPAWTVCVITAAVSGTDVAVGVTTGVAISGAGDGAVTGTVAEIDGVTTTVVAAAGVGVASATPAAVAGAAVAASILKGVAVATGCSTTADGKPAGSSISAGNGSKAQPLAIQSANKANIHQRAPRDFRFKRSPWTVAVLFIDVFSDQRLDHGDMQRNLVVFDRCIRFEQNTDRRNLLASEPVGAIACQLKTGK